MPDLEADILALRARINAAQRARVRAEHERDAAQAVADKVHAQLAAEYGVSTADTAHSVLRALEHDLHAAIEDLRAHLDDAGV